MKIGWICAGSINSGGSRMSVFNNHHYFLSIGIDSKIIHAPTTYCIEYNPSNDEINNIIKERFDIVFIQKVSIGGIKNFIKILQNNGVKVVFGIGDFFGHEMVGLCDYTVAASEYLKNLYPKQFSEKIKVIMDGYETPENLKKEHVDSDILNVIYYGTQNIDNDFEKNINSIPWINFKKLGNPPWTNIKWELNTVYNNILNFDVCLIYAKMTDFNKSKSLNRPLNCMVMGVPVISSPIPSYDSIIENEINSFIVRSNLFEDFKKYLIYLKDFNKRKEIGYRARQSVIKKKSKINQSKEYLELFSNILKENE